MCFAIVLLYVLHWTVSSPVLEFNEDGTFKILVVADLHFNPICEDIPPSPYVCNGFNSTAFIRKVIDAEKPDLVVFVGDTIDEGTIDAKLGMNITFGLAFSQGIPFAVVMGNHDQQAQAGHYGRKGILQYTETLPFSLSELGPEEVQGYGNYKLQIFQSSKPKYNLFMMDSLDFNHDYPWVESRYDWMRESQLHWFNEETKKDGEELLPASVFFHIPIREYQDLINSRVPIIGDHLDSMHDSKINSGAFGNFVTMKNVNSVFVGHAHINDFCGLYAGIQLCFAGGSGFGSYGKADWPRRVRLLSLELFGDVMVTWKRLNDKDFTKKDHQILWVKNKSEK